MSTKTERTAVIEELEREFRGAAGIYVTNNHKITVEAVTKLRSELRKNGVRFIVVKNTLAKEACKKVGIDSLDSYFKGPTAVAVAPKDSTVPAKILRDFRKEYKDLLEVKAAYVDGSLFVGEQATRLADLPSREALLAQLLGVLKAPVGNMAGVLSGVLTKFVRTLDAVREKKSA
ncbi:MAG: 50S ribosomal protein L10 [Chitinispirillales bacterium]|jgi:large subunit ribosomal protein L10|nr:50S ribosomal protein L10 [Chitinispirillales bacterium]